MVTAQVADYGSDGSEGEDQLFRLLPECREDIPTLLSGGREHGSDDREVVSAGLGTESAGDFLAQLHHPGVAFGLVVGEGHVRIVQKPQYVVPALVEAPEEIMADASRLPAAALGAAQRRHGLMEGEPLRHNGVVASLDARDQTRLERAALLAGEICGVAGAGAAGLYS